MATCTAPVTNQHIPGSDAERECPVHGVKYRQGAPASAAVRAMPPSTAHDRAAERPELNSQMEFGGAYTIDADGEVKSSSDYPPSFIDDECDGSGWTPVTGFSGQHGYSGPVMHPSEQLGGKMEDYVYENPGTYALVEAIYTTDEDGNEQDWGSDMPEGWVLLRKNDDAPETTPATDNPYADAMNPLSSVARVSELAKSDNSSVRMLAAEHHRVTPETLDSLATDKDQAVRLAVASSEQAFPRTLSALAQDADERVVNAVAANDKTPNHTLLAIAQSGPTHNIRELARDAYDNKMSKVRWN